MYYFLQKDIFKIGETKDLLWRFYWDRCSLIVVSTYIDLIKIFRIFAFHLSTSKMEHLSMDLKNNNHVFWFLPSDLQQQKQLKRFVTLKA